MNAIGAHRGESVTILTLCGEDTKVQHYLTDADVSLLIEALRESARPRWVFAGSHTGWQCNRCGRYVEQEERPAECQCAAAELSAPDVRDEVRRELRVFRAVALSMPAPKLGEWNWPEIAERVGALLAKLGVSEDPVAP